MNLAEILNEGRDAPLYHGMTPAKARSVFTRDTLPASWTHNIPGLGKVQGNSFSRNKLLKYGYVVITVNQTKLAQTYKIIPLDGEYVHSARHDGVPSTLPYARDRNAINMFGDKKLPAQLLSEEFVVGDISNLHKYILSISVGESDFGREILKKNQILELRKFSQRYADKWNIELK